MAWGALALVSSGPLLAGFNERGNVLIADQFNNRVIEVDPAGTIVWSFGTGSSAAGPGTVVAPNDAERVGTLTLISGTGGPAGSEPSCPDGCNDSRVLLVDRNGKIAWQYGQAGVNGDGFNQLNAPVCSVYLPNGHVLITDQGNQRIIEVTRKHQIVWQYGMTGVAASGPNQLNNPNSAELLENGHILIADESNNRVIDQVIEINPEKKVVFSKGVLGVAGGGATLLNAPYDAKVIGDFTGLTPPFEDEDCRDGDE